MALPWNNVGYKDPLGVPMFGRGMSSLIHVQLEIPRNLTASNQRLDKDKVVSCSIWSSDQGVIVIQWYRTTLGQPRDRGWGCPAAKAGN
jgi:hypothetical protein